MKKQANPFMKGQAKAVQNQKRKIGSAILNTQAMPAFFNGFFIQFKFLV
ncbi:MAG: hypothetical protein WC322_03165 [Candidatus Paceibacterota bacterium]